MPLIATSASRVVAMASSASDEFVGSRLRKSEHEVSAVMVSSMAAMSVFLLIVVIILLLLCC